MNKFYAALGLCAAACFAHAAEEGNPTKVKKPFQAELEIGVILTSGNTNTESYKGKINAIQRLNHWRNQYIVEGLFQKDEIELEDEEATHSKKIPPPPKNTLPRPRPTTNCRAKRELCSCTASTIATALAALITNTLSRSVTPIICLPGTTPC